MFSYHLGAFVGSAATPATASIGRSMMRAARAK